MSRDLAEFKNVVVYRIGSLGDTLVALPAFHLVRRAFPKARITLLTNLPTNPKAVPMESVLEGGKFFDDVVRYRASTRDIKTLFELMKALKGGAYDCLVYMASPKGGLFTSVRDYLFFRACGIPKVVGVPFSHSVLHSERVPGSDLYTSRMSRSLRALKDLGEIDASDPAAWNLALTPAEDAEAEALLLRHGITGPFLAAGPGTKMQAKDWEEDNWLSLMRRLAEEFPTVPLVLFGSRDEAERGGTLAAAWRAPAANLCGAASPRVIGAAMRRAAVMVCHDSGPMHLAAVMQVPCVAIFSARAKPGEWFPRGNGHTVFYHKTPCWDCGLEVCVENRKACILSITVDEVFDAVVGQLARKGIAARTQPALPAGRAGVAGAPPGRDDASTGLRILLIGNYVPDAQESMQRFSSVLAGQLSASGHAVTLLRPEPVFGRLRPGANGLGKWLGYIDKFLVFPRRLKRRIKEMRGESADGFVVHICDHSNAYYTRYLRDVPHVVTCHDLLAVRSALGEIPENRVRWSGRIQQGLVARGLEGASNIVCDSKATHRDLLRLIKGSGTRSSVAAIGLNAPFRPVPRDEARERVMARMKELGMPMSSYDRYIFHVGGETWYKNRKGVVEMFCELRRLPETHNLLLLLIGKPLSRDLRAFIRDEGLADSIREVPSVSHEDLCAIYSAAELLLFPSLLEGFGWPIIEAQACGCPVVTSGRPPMNDVGGDGAAYLDPGDLWASVEVLVNVLFADPEEKKAMIRRGFDNAALYTTRNMIDSYRQTYMSVARTPQ